MGGEIRRKKQMRFDRNRRNSTGNSIISRLSAPCPLVLSTRRHPAEPHLFFPDLHTAHPNAPPPGKHPGRRRHLRYVGRGCHGSRIGRKKVSSAQTEQDGGWGRKRAKIRTARGCAGCSFIMRGEIVLSGSSTI